jgi:DNA-binding protein H-NS
VDIDLDTLSLKELKELQARVAKSIATYEDRAKKAALAVLEEKARELGFPLAELLKVGAEKTRGAGGRAKYANPANPSQTWSGRGRKPGWFAAALEAGKRPEDMAI